MPAFPMAPLDVIRVSTFCWHPTAFQLGVNIRHFQVDVTSPTLPNTAWLAGWDIGIQSLYLPCLGTDANYYGTRMESVTHPELAADTLNANQAAGTAASTCLPLEISGLYTKYTGFRGRSGRGRAYIPFPATVHQFLDNTITAAYQALLTNLANTAENPFAIGLSTLNPVIYSPARPGPTPPPRPVHIYPIQVRAVSTVFAAQHRRGAFGRKNALPF